MAFPTLPLYSPLVKGKWGEERIAEGRGEGRREERERKGGDSKGQRRRSIPDWRLLTSTDLLSVPAMGLYCRGQVRFGRRQSEEISGGVGKGRTWEWEAV